MKHTPGPWVYDSNHSTIGRDTNEPPPVGDGEDWQGLSENPFWDVCTLVPHAVYEYRRSGQTFPKREDVKRRAWDRSAANGQLLANAPAMLLVLELLTLGLARIRRSESCDLVEFGFKGMLYGVPKDGNWNVLVSTIGWDAAQLAITEAKTKLA